MNPPLSGVLVADFSRVLAGPLATMTLADLGATVIKVERPGTGDDTRHWGPPWSSAGSTYFASVNRSKASLTLDLTQDHDRGLAAELARRADVLVENFKPGLLPRLGLGYEEVRATNPGIVYCSITGFGAGAGADLLGYDFLVQAVGGLMSITGEPDGEPTKAGVALVDVLTGKDATIGILATLAQREQTGRGNRIEVNLLSSSLAALVNQAQSFLQTGQPPRRMDNQHPSIAPYETLRCRDRPLAIACGNDAQFARLVEVLGEARLAEDPRFARNPDRVQNREQLVAALETRLRTADAVEWERRLTPAGVAVGVVGDLADAFALAETLGLRPTQQPAPGHAPQVRHPVDYGGDVLRPPEPPPELGEHDASLRQWLSGPAGAPVPGHR